MRLIQLLGLVLLAFLHVQCQLNEVIFHSNHKRCQKIYKRETRVEGTGCVAPQSIPLVNKDCNRCLYNYQCASNWCHSSWKVCYHPSLYCLAGQGAGCRNCPSERDADLTKCICEKEDFPNNWVNCYNGSGEVDTYRTEPRWNYQRKDNSRRNRLNYKRDRFALHTQCATNRYREMVGLQPLRWNKRLAEKANNWTQHLVLHNNCSSAHSPISDRSNLFGWEVIGENLFRKPVLSEVTDNHIPVIGRDAIDAFFAELYYYQYPGPDRGSQECPLRNDPDNKKTVGHLTQLLWEGTTHMGCDYSICQNPNGHIYSYMLVSCMYGPSGNIAGQPAFNETVYNNINNNEELVQYFGQVPKCDLKEESDNVCEIERNNGSIERCEFPWTSPHFPNNVTSCQNYLDKRASATKAFCYSTNNIYVPCPTKTDDPDCYWEPRETTTS